MRSDQYSGYMPNTSARAWGTKLASCPHCLAFMALRAAATARAAGVESGSAIVAPACTVVLGVIVGAYVEDALAGDTLVDGARIGAVEGAIEGAGGAPVTGTSVPSACKTNLEGPAASAVCAEAEAAGWAQASVCVKVKSAQALASQAPNPQF